MHKSNAKACIILYFKMREQSILVVWETFGREQRFEKKKKKSLENFGPKRSSPASAIFITLQD